MSQTDTIARTEYKPHELLEAGASRAFIRYYETAKMRNERTPAVNHVEKVATNLKELAENPATGGSFFEALWNDGQRGNSSNPYGADKKNSRILSEAGVDPYGR